MITFKRNIILYGPIESLNPKSIKIEKQCIEPTKLRVDTKRIKTNVLITE